MTDSQARDAINGAAIIIAGLYFYRKLIEPQTPQTRRKRQPSSLGATAGQVLGVGPLASTGRFVVGFGFTFLTLSIVEGISPKLAGSFAILVAVGAVLGNGMQVSADLRAQLSERNRALNKVGIATEPNPPTVQVADWVSYPGTSRNIIHN